jgi:hypothetical protein
MKKHLFTPGLTATAMVAISPVRAQNIVVTRGADGQPLITGETDGSATAAEARPTKNSGGWRIHSSNLITLQGSGVLEQ